jgi:hypothetical protein
MYLERQVDGGHAHLCAPLGAIAASVMNIDGAEADSLLYGVVFYIAVCASCANGFAAAQRLCIHAI